MSNTIQPNVTVGQANTAQGVDGAGGLTPAGEGDLQQLLAFAENLDRSGFEAPTYEQFLAGVREVASSTALKSALSNVQDAIAEAVIRNIG